MKLFCVAILVIFQFKLAAQSGNFYTQGNHNRLAAEWEPAIGTMIIYPLCIPYKLAVELAKDNHLYTLVANDSLKAEAIKWYKEWGIDTARNTFIVLPQSIDAWWVRDWGPAAVFTPGGKMKLADGKYIYATPVTNLPCDDSLYFIYQTADHQIIKTDTEDHATAYLGKALNIELIDLPYVSTGGNVLTDGLGTAFSTCILLNENRFYGVDQNAFLKYNQDLLGISSYHIISNFEKRGIQHIDCLLKPLDEERILVIEPPADHALYPIYQNIVDNELSKLKTPYGRPYEIVRMKTYRYYKQMLAAYSNSIIINKNIYVPLFHIAGDSAALQRWRELMPGYTVKGFEFSLADEPDVSAEMKEHYQSYGWDHGDALHCRTRAVWDPEMLFMTCNKIEKEINATSKPTVYATILDYSKKGIVEKETAINWRIKGEKKWRKLALKRMDDPTHFSATIPVQKAGIKVEYYVSSGSKSGKKETMPRTAPLGYYQFQVR